MRDGEVGVRPQRRDQRFPLAHPRAPRRAQDAPAPSAAHGPSPPGHPPPRPRRRKTASVAHEDALLPGRGRSARAEEAALNVLLITPDQQRADTLGAYGASLRATPNLDQLASEGTVFTEAYCQHPY